MNSRSRDLCSSSSACFCRLALGVSRLHRRFSLRRGLATFRSCATRRGGSWELPVWGVLLGLGILLLTIAFGIRARRRWARPLILAVWLLEGAVNVIGFVRSGQAYLLWVPFLLFSGWYLYKKQNVVGYFARSREA